MVVIRYRLALKFELVMAEFKLSHRDYYDYKLIMIINSKNAP